MSAFHRGFITRGETLVIGGTLIDYLMIQSDSHPKRHPSRNSYSSLFDIDQQQHLPASCQLSCRAMPRIEEESRLVSHHLYS